MNKTLKNILIAAGVSLVVSSAVVWASHEVDFVKDVIGK